MNNLKLFIFIFFRGLYTVLSSHLEYIIYINYSPNHIFNSIIITKKKYMCFKCSMKINHKLLLEYLCIIILSIICVLHKSNEDYRLKRTHTKVVKYINERQSVLLFFKLLLSISAWPKSGIDKVKTFYIHLLSL